ncbi:MAG: hypothetical protein KatS3mg103_0174 [Phycisphaerales bacterium]|nr:MAG: hypothetical protein KatS3mg103_0174 [Phycisphaerales bacterium]
MASRGTEAAEAASGAMLRPPTDGARWPSSRISTDASSTIDPAKLVSTIPRREPSSDSSTDASGHGAPLFALPSVVMRRSVPW